MGVPASYIIRCFRNTYDVSDAGYVAVISRMNCSVLQTETEQASETSYIFLIHRFDSDLECIAFQSYFVEEFGKATNSGPWDGDKH